MIFKAFQAKIKSLLKLIDFKKFFIEDFKGPNKLENEKKIKYHSNLKQKNREKFKLTYQNKYKEAKPIIVIDCQYQNILKDYELISLAQQISCSIGISKKHNNIAKLVITDYKQKIQKMCEKNNSLKWGINTYTENFLNYFDRNDIIYLSPNAIEVLEKIDQNKVYVIGGIVDKKIKTNMSLQTAEKLQLRSQRLPITEHINIKCSQILTITTIVDLFHRLLNQQSWSEALKKSIPKRKQEENQLVDEKNYNFLKNNSIILQNDQKINNIELYDYQQSKNKIEVNHKISLAPMLDYSTIYFRNFIRCLTKHAVNYTEMINENAILHNKKGSTQFLKFYNQEKPIVLQIGGSSPEKCAQCCQISEQLGYDEINFNMGCPSERVQENNVGACLMKDQELAVRILKQMKKAVSIPITVKCRIGVDDMDTYDFFKNFIDKISNETGIEHFIVHARKVYLKGLNPEQNRNVPPLNYDTVLQIKRDFPHLKFSINGGFNNFRQITEYLDKEKQLEGVMLGRLAINNPWVLSKIDSQFYQSNDPSSNRKEVIMKYAQFCQFIQQNDQNISLIQMIKPIMQIFYNETESKLWKQMLHQSMLVEKNIQKSILNSLQIFEDKNPIAVNSPNIQALF